MQLGGAPGTSLTSWGPLARNFEDTEVVMQAISDENALKNQKSIAPLPWNSNYTIVNKYRIGYVM